MPNALAAEKSPYLLQHADNPVNWLPWGEPAFAQARAEQRPIFLSIGYATCHWCHVMARESFEDPGVAALLNESFIAIKVDREERPDVDKVYMTYVQAMTGHGGWPLSAWLTPDLKPFFGGTYFPPDDRGGRSGFGALLRAIAQGWATDRAKLIAEGERVIAVLREHFGQAATTTPAGPGKSLVDAGGEAFEKCFQYFFEAFDPEHGGFGSAPKFPRASNLNFLFRAAALQGMASESGAEAVKLASATCRSMVQGGIHDHVGGGYHRYSVDAAWFVPHFEKMLYDQAQIAVNLLEAKQATGDERFAWAARDVFDYVQRELAAPGGGFYSAEDADSEVPQKPAEPAGHGRHAEGAFYVWTHDEISAALGDDAALFCRHFGVDPNGNVPAELDPHHELAGKNILAQRQTLAATAQAQGIGVEEASQRLTAALLRLREVRSRRPRPLRDDKIITAWNGLMISALAKAHQILTAPSDAPAGVGGTGTDPLDAATQAARFLQRELYDAEHDVLYRSWRGQRGSVEGFAEDYALLIQGLLDLYEAGFDVGWLQWAERLQQGMDERFWDDERGGYFNSRANDPAIVLRLKEDYDGAEPAPTSVAAMNLLRLGAVLDPAGERGFCERGRRCLEAFRPQWSKTAHALPQMLCAFERALLEPAHVVIAGDPRSPDFRAMAAVISERLRPSIVLLAADGAAGQQWLSERAPWMAGMTASVNGARAYVCEDFSCQAPVETPDELRAVLDKSARDERSAG